MSHQEEELDDILTRTLEEFEIEENVENPIDSSDKTDPVAQPSSDGASPYTSLEQIMDMLAEESGDDELGNDSKDTEDYEKLLQGLLGQLSSFNPEKEGSSQQQSDNSAAFTGDNNLNGVERELEKVMEAIVKQLLSKEILQVPMEQLYERYCTWLDENQPSPQDHSRFMQQKELVFQICEEYRGEGNTDKVLELLQQMQNLGAPPPNVISQTEEGDSNDAQLRELQNLQNQCPTQ